MKFTTFMNHNNQIKAAWVKEDGIYDMHQISHGKLPDNLLDFIKNSARCMPLAEKLETTAQPTWKIDEVQMAAPLPNPPSVRDFMAFELHVLNASKRKGRPVASEWYELPAFYFTNHLVLSGTNEKIERPPGCLALDYELEIACIIGKEGKNIKADEAEEYIFGYTIMNDWSARDLQRKEMKIGLGPAKGKDFATSIGPYIVTKNELEPFRIHDRYELAMTATVNGMPLSQGNAKDMYYSFGQMIERASAGVKLYPGDIIGSGTVGTGCILELGPEVHRWLEPGDIVELEITGLGRLINQIV
ncbi:fumarylacetoacetate hydrolase family protein [Bacillus sp. BRMEA1]|uniref:fumarylacetoacetate hydrolase family protein n=1 Tax=Neobacillus endophyticus TaxID=2738405 RepID=UPI0015642CA1|nr:fumarylacetoacetate hydrolase family protein [Neobacillus endophyticus]NRD79676.1 fumarylacetoacetate hydrolase family protein [Neobacillus endophyticus]